MKHVSAPERLLGRVQQGSGPAQTEEIEFVGGTWDATAKTLTVSASSGGFSWMGEWNAATAYAVDDVVTRRGSTYVIIVANTGFDPTTSPTYATIFQATGEWTPKMVNDLAYLHGGI